MEHLGGTTNGMRGNGDVAAPSGVRENGQGVAAPVNLFRTRDADEAQAYMGGIFRSHHLRLTRGGALQMRHERLPVGRVSAHWLSYGGEATMTAPEMGDFYLFQFTLQGACEIEHGGEVAQVGKGLSYAVDPNRPLSKKWSKDCRQFILRIERDALDAFAAQETGVHTAGRLSFAFRLMPAVYGPAVVLRLVEALRQHAPGREGLGHFRVARHIETTLMSLVLANFPHSLGEEYDRAAQPCAPYYVRRAEMYMRAHAREPIGLDDLVTAAGVSTRSLFAGFKRFRDTTPMAHLKAVRLDLAYADLAAADPRRATVTEIANDCGFGHMSKFARDFKARFGMTPITVLKSASLSQSSGPARTQTR